MEKYQVRSGTNEPFRLVRGNETLGTLNYPSSYNTTRAEINLQGSTELLQVKAPGFLKTNLELWQGAQCIAASKLGWDLSVSLTIAQKTYQLKVKHLGKGVFNLLDDDKTALITIVAEMDWKSGKAAFEVEVCHNRESFRPEILLFLVHNCNYFLALSGNGGSTEALLAGI